MKYLVDKFKKFRESFNDILIEWEESAISSNMRIEGYTDFEIYLAIENLRKMRQN